jgi:hypothetical protein
MALQLRSNAMSLWPKPSVLLGSFAVSTLTALSFAPNIAKADFTIAYCDGENYAINVYRTGDPEAPTSALKIRIYDRSDKLTFLNTEANREPNPEGYNYSNLRGERQWTLFIANDLEAPCTLSRDGQVVDRGTVTMREPPSSAR